MHISDHLGNKVQVHVHFFLNFKKLPVTQYGNLSQNQGFLIGYIEILHRAQQLV